MHFTKLVTHNGLFHADEVFCVATMRLLGCDAPVLRLPNVPDGWADDPSILIFDIGFGPFDHHQLNKKLRPDTGVPYAAFGLLILEFKDRLFKDDMVYKRFDKIFVEPMDASDNGCGPRTNLMTKMIEAFNPAWDDFSSNADEAFQRAVDIAIPILKQQLIRNEDICRVYELKKDLIVEDGIVYMDFWAPISECFENDKDVCWVCFPSPRGGYSICSLVGPDQEYKARLPKEFWGKSEDELPDGMVFCHTAGFIATFESIMDARLFILKYLLF